MQATRPGIQIKATTFRSYVELLSRDGKLDAIKALVPATTAQLLEHPPLASSWMDFLPLVHVTVALEKHSGIVAVRDFHRRVTDETRKPYMRLVEGLLQLFGTSPATLFKRMNDMVKHFIRNLHYTYTETGARSGLMEVFYDVDFDVPMCSMIGPVQTFYVIMESCGAKGVVGTPEKVATNRVRFPLQW